MTLELGLTQDQRTLRRGRIGASNAPGIMGISPWSSPIQEWARIVDPSDDDMRNDAQTAGLLFEGSLLRWFANELPASVEQGETMIDPDRDWLLATPDGIVRRHGAAEPVEVKFVSPRQAERWRDGDGIVRAPDYVRAQSLHQQIVTRARCGYIVACVVFFEGVKLHWERVEPSEAEREIHIAACDVFFHQHIATRVPPPVDASSRTTELLTKRHPKADGTWLEPTPSDLDLRIARALLAEQVGDMKKQLDEIDNKIRARIGDAEGIHGVARWRNRDGSIKYSAACKEAGLDADFLGKFRGAPTRVLVWEE